MTRKQYIVLQPSETFHKWLMISYKAKRNYENDLAEVQFVFHKLLDEYQRVLELQEPFSQAEIKSYLESNAQIILSDELKNWVNEKNLWPQELDLKTLQQFFDINIIENFSEQATDPIPTSKYFVRRKLANSSTKKAS